MVSPNLLTQWQSHKLPYRLWRAPQCGQACRTEFRENPVHLHAICPRRTGRLRVLGMAYATDGNKTGSAAQSIREQPQPIKPAAVLRKHRDERVETVRDSRLCQGKRKRIIDTKRYLDRDCDVATRFRFPRGSNSFKGMTKQRQARGVEQGSIATGTQIEADVIGNIPRTTKSGSPLVRKSGWRRVDAHADADPDTRSAGQVRGECREARGQRVDAEVATFLPLRRDGAEFNAVES